MLWKREFKKTDFMDKSDNNESLFTTEAADSSLFVKDIRLPVLLLLSSPVGR